MTETTSPTLSGVAETLLLPLYIRAMESQRPDALLKDDKAVALVKQMNYDSSWMTKMRVDEEDKVGLVLRNREFDRFVQDFLTRNPEAVVVHIGCGLDARFERVDNGRVEWFDLDLPEVIELRRQFIGGEGDALSSPGSFGIRQRVARHGERPLPAPVSLSGRGRSDVLRWSAGQVVGAGFAGTFR